MRTALRYYHSIPSLQRDDTTRQHMYDAARMKTVLKGCVGNENPPVGTPSDILNRQTSGIIPACNPVAALFAFTTHSNVITKEHFKECEFMDLFLPVPIPSRARARALLWLLYRYLEDAKGTNPFQEPSSKSQKTAPPLPRMSIEDMDLENVDTPDEIEYGRRMLQYRVEFLNKTEAEFAQDAARGKIDPNANIRGQRAMKKKVAMGRAVQEELAAMETQSNMSRDSSLPPHGGPDASDAFVHATIGNVSSVSAQQLLLAQTEQNARHLLSQPPSVSLVNRKSTTLRQVARSHTSIDAMNHMVTSMIDSEDEDNEPYSQMILGESSYRFFSSYTLLMYFGIRPKTCYFTYIL